MPKRCFILNCPTGRKSCEEKAALFKAPKDEELLEKWRRVIPQKGARVFRNVHFICEKHFEKKCVISRWQPSSVGDFFVDNIRSKLAKKAVPSIFPEVDQNDPRLETYVPEPPKPFVTFISKTKEMQAKEEFVYVDVEVSDSDYVPICFNCLIGKCYSHPQDFH